MANYVLPSVVEKRVRYFDGQFLQDQDFIDEQNYQVDREHRHNRLLHGPGIAEGLTVTSTASNQVTVAPGTAIDSDGYQLVLAQATTVDLPATDFNDKQGIELYIGYLQSAEDPQTVGGSGDFTRWLERPQLTALAPGEAYSGTAPPVLLAKVALDNAGRAAVDNTVRSYSGLRLPGSGADAATFRTTSSGPVDLAGSLTVDGNVGIGTTSPGAKLQVSGGAAQFDGNQQILFTDDGTSNNLKLQLWSGYGLGINPGTLFYAANGRHSWRDSGANERMALTTAADGGLTVTGTGASSFAGSVGIGTTTPSARLSVVGTGATEIAGTAHSTVLRTSAGALGGSRSNELVLSSTGLVVGSNSMSLGVRAIRTADGSDWPTAAIGLGMDVDNTARAGAALFLHANGNVGIGTATPSARLSVVQPGATEIGGTAQSGVFRTSAAALGGKSGNEVLLSSTGLAVSNSLSLGVRAIRTADGSDWRTTAIGLGMDVDNTARAGAALFLHANGSVGIGTTSPWPSPWVKLLVSGGAAQFDGNYGIMLTNEEPNKPTDNLKLQLRSGYGLGANLGTLFYAANGRHSWRDANGTNERMALTTAADGGLTVMGTGASSFAGNVGIGATSPTSDLQIGDFAFQDRYLAFKVAGGNSYRSGIKLWTWKENYGYSIQFDERAAGPEGLHVKWHGGNADGGTLVFVQPGGNVGVGTTSPQALLDVAGDIKCAGRIVYPSDARLKEQVIQIPDALDRISRMRGVQFSWNADGLRHFARDIEATTTVGPDATKEQNEQLWQELRHQRYERLSGRNIGLLAQEVEQVAPELVCTDDEGFKSVDYSRLTAVLVEAVKEQQSLIGALSDRIATIERGA